MNCMFRRSIALLSCDDAVQLWPPVGIWEPDYSPDRLSSWESLPSQPKPCGAAAELSVYQRLSQFGTGRSGENGR
jgi:hypothetical protein